MTPAREHSEFPTMDRAVVALSLDRSDANLLPMAASLCRALKIEEIRLAWVWNRGQLPEELAASLGPRPTDEQVAEALLKEASSVNWGPQAKLETDVEPGARPIDALRLAADRDADLLCIGSMAPEGTPLSTREQRMVSSSPCTVLSVPNRTSEAVRRILLPTDFSNPAEQALRGALHLAEACGGSRVTALHVDDVPTGFDKSGMTFDEFADHLREIAQNRWSEVLQRVPQAKHVTIRYELIPHDDRSHEISHVISDVANEIDADLTIVGGYGWTGLARMFVGSVVQGLLARTTRPVLCVKNKGESRGLLDFLFSG